MGEFEDLQNIDNFCTVLVKKTGAENPEVVNPALKPEIEEPLIDVFDEEEHVRILVQCRCREQQVTFHPSPDGIIVCKQECHKPRDGPEVCNDVCRKVPLETHRLQLNNMLFVMAKCNNNNTLEAMIPKVKT